ncbi:MAG: glycosyltransferase family 2 protein [Gemmatimonadales bacterium]|nr:MAG: glycosyltransferase family 2 protein [Gemmatimonadales bacterium]
MSHRSRPGDSMSTPRASPRVSVIMTFLDPPLGFFREAVESVFDQTFPDWELIFVNDGSGREASRAAEEFVRLDPSRVRCLAHDGGVNLGIPASRNLALAHARGEFIACLDADDVWDLAKLAAQVRILDARPDVDMLFGRHMLWRSWEERDGVGRVDQVPSLGVADRTEFRPGSFLPLVMRSRISIPPPSSVMVRAPAVRSVGGFGEGVSNHYEDQAFYAKVSLRGVVLACDDVWCRYRIHDGSVTHGATRAEGRAARREFLDWLENYLAGQGALDAPIRRTLRLERWAAMVPRGPGILRVFRRIPRYLARGIPGQ